MPQKNGLQVIEEVKEYYKSQSAGLRV